MKIESTPNEIVKQRIVFTNDARGAQLPNREHHQPKPVKQKRLAKTVLIASLVNLFCVLIAWAGLLFISERWWITAALTYLPRIPMLIPAAILAAVAAFCCRRYLLVNLISIGIVVFPIMGFVVPTSSWFGDSANGDELVIISCNVQRFEPRFSAVVSEIGKTNPDVVVLQEAPDEHKLLKDVFPEWHTIHDDEYWIGSRYPIEIVSRCQSGAFNRQTAIYVEVSTPQGKVAVCNIHQTTARHGLVELGHKSLTEGTGQRKLERHVALREEEAYSTSAFVYEIDPTVPLIVAGDFNMPSSSHIYQTAWSDFSNAFEVAGWGTGYTSPCSSHTIWPSNTPWLRIDHILVNGHWQVQESHIGTGNGSDHRLIAARLRLRKGNSAD